MGRSGEFAVSDPPGIRLVRRRGAVVISTRDGEMQDDCMAQVVLQPRRRTGDVRQMPFGAQLCGRDHPRSGADDMCSRSGRLRVLEGARGRRSWRLTLYHEGRRRRELGRRIASRHWQVLQRVQTSASGPQERDHVGRPYNCRHHDLGDIRLARFVSKSTVGS
jgi:hypothetical protein